MKELPRLVSLITNEANKATDLLHAGAIEVLSAALGIDARNWLVTLRVEIDDATTRAALLYAADLPEHARPELAAAVRQHAHSLMDRSNAVRHAWAADAHAAAIQGAEVPRGLLMDLHSRLFAMVGYLTAAADDVETRVWPTRTADAERLKTESGPLAVAIECLAHFNQPPELAANLTPAQTRNLCALLWFERDRLTYAAIRDRWVSFAWEPRLIIEAGKMDEAARAVKNWINHACRHLNVETTPRSENNPRAHA